MKLKWKIFHCFAMSVCLFPSVLFAEGTSVYETVIVSNKLMQESTSDKSYFMGKLGVGTNDPAEAVHIKGKLKMENNIILNGNYLSGDGGNEGIYIDSAGCVGVGTIGTGNKFESLGVDNVNAGLFRGSATSGKSWGLMVAAGSTSADAAFRVENAAMSASYIYVKGDGKVGLGTESPSEKLHVNGKGRFDQGVSYIYPLGDLGMGTYTNQ